MEKVKLRVEKVFSAEYGMMEVHFSPVILPLQDVARLIEKGDVELCLSQS